MKSESGIILLLVFTLAAPALGVAPGKNTKIHKGSKTTRVGPKTTQVGPKTTQEVHKTTQAGPRTTTMPVASSSAIVDCSSCFPKSSQDKIRKAIDQLKISGLTPDNKAICKMYEDATNCVNKATKSHTDCGDVTDKLEKVKDSMGLFHLGCDAMCTDRASQCFDDIIQRIMSKDPPYKVDTCKSYKSALVCSSKITDTLCQAKIQEQKRTLNTFLINDYCDTDGEIGACAKLASKCQAAYDNLDNPHQDRDTCYKFLHQYSGCIDDMLKTCSQKYLSENLVRQKSEALIGTWTTTCEMAPTKASATVSPGNNHCLATIQACVDKVRDWVVANPGQACQYGLFNDALDCVNKAKQDNKDCAEVADKVKEVEDVLTRYKRKCKGHSVTTVPGPSERNKCLTAARACFTKTTEDRMTLLERNAACQIYRSALNCFNTAKRDNSDCDAKTIDVKRVRDNIESHKDICDSGNGASLNIRYAPWVLMVTYFLTQWVKM